jgi:signal transduction histidine kinase
MKWKQKQVSGQPDNIELITKEALITNLQTHQIELEMQNKELREIQQQLEESRDRYIALYDYAPVGYLTLDMENARILEINLRGADMLKSERAYIIGKFLITFIEKEDASLLVGHLHDIYNTPGNVKTELKIKTRGNNPTIVRLESSAIQDKNIAHVIMTDISHIKLISNHNLDLVQQNRMLTRKLFITQEEERRHISMELHDELGQWLSAISAEAETISSNAYRATVVKSSTQSIKQIVSTIHNIIHNLLYKLRPTLLDTLGLVDSLHELRNKWHAHHPNVKCALILEGKMNDFDEIINITIYRIIQESLNNICSHSGADQVLIYLGHISNINNSLLLKIEDNGKGYNPNQLSSGFGILGMRERVIAADGEFNLYSAPGCGTQIHITLPI